jgi:arginase
VQRFVIISAPSILGLQPTGVEYLPEALKAAGLLKKLNAEYAGEVSSQEYNSKRDEETLLLNPAAIRQYSNQLAKAVTNVLQGKRFPMVLGGDCSIIIGNLLALRRLGRYGLFFIDGHADFYQPEASPTGEVADMDPAIVSGRGPNILANIDGLKPLVPEEDIVLFGNRDTEQAKSYGCQDVSETDINVFDFDTIQEVGPTKAASDAIKKLVERGIQGFWIHLDVDVLNNKDMPAVDYRLPAGGLAYDDVSQLLQILVRSGKAVGMDITIFNPKLDSDGSIAYRLVSSLVDGLALR